MVINYNGEDFNEMIKDRVLVDSYANWCGPCKLLAPVLENVSNDIKVIKIDIDKYRDIARGYGVMSIPTLVFFKNGKTERVSVGLISSEELSDIIDSLV